MKLTRLLLAVLFCGPAAMTATHTQAPYQPPWESRSRHEIPLWLKDAKFGLQPPAAVTGA